MNDEILISAIKSWKPQWYSGEWKIIGDKYVLKHSPGVVRLFERGCIDVDPITVFIIGDMGWEVYIGIRDYFSDKSLADEIIKAAQLAIPIRQRSFNILIKLEEELNAQSQMVAA